MKGTDRPAGVTHPAELDESYTDNACFNHCCIFFQRVLLTPAHT